MVLPLHAREEWLLCFLLNKCPHITFRPLCPVWTGHNHHPKHTTTTTPNSNTYHITHFFCYVMSKLAINPPSLSPSVIRVKTLLSCFGSHETEEYQKAKDVCSDRNSSGVKLPVSLTEEK